MSTNQSIVSLGQACCYLQQMPEVFHRAAAELNVGPVSRVNFVPHYAESDIERIAQHLQARTSGGQRVSPIGAVQPITPIQ
jgi:hypothetical protein